MVEISSTLLAYNKEQLVNNFEVCLLIPVKVTFDFWGGVCFEIYLKQKILDELPE